MTATLLPDRAVIEVRGAEARAFLDRVVSCAVEPVGPERAAYGALLSPQGKILSDFVILASRSDPESFWLDAPETAAADLVRRLGLYRLRAKLAIADRSADFRVATGWDEPAPGDAVATAPDPRLAELGWRAILPADAVPPEAEPAAYHARRVALGVPETGRDVALGDAFPHEALMDQLGGVDFGKGCYVGQEVVSRMQHRGTARTRVVSLAYEGPAPEPGTPVLAGGRTLGATGGASGGRGLATIRLDRAAEALAAGEPILAGGRPVRFAKPGWVRFPYPGELAGPGEPPA